jgi:nucleoside-diphosphate-sugar epimerase
MTVKTILNLLLLFLSASATTAFHVVIAGGTGELGRALSSSLVKDGQQVTILCRNGKLSLLLHQNNTCAQFNFLLGAALHLLRRCFVVEYFDLIVETFSSHC